MNSEGLQSKTTGLIRQSLIALLRLALIETNDWGGLSPPHQGRGPSTNRGSQANLAVLPSLESSCESQDRLLVADLIHPTKTSGKESCRQPGKAPRYVATHAELIA